MAQMNFQYPNMGASFAQGVDTGQKLGSMWEKKDNSGAIPVPEVPQRQQVNPADYMTQDTKELQTYKEYRDKMKKMSPEEQDSVWRELNSSGVLTSPIIKQAYANNIKPEDIQKVMSNVANGKPTAQADLKLLRKSFNDNPEVNKYLDDKIAEIQGTQKQMDNEWGIKTMTALNSLKHVHDNPKGMMGKAGQFDPSVIKAIQNEENAVNGLIGMGGEFADYGRKYLADVYNKTRDSNPTDKSVILSGYNTKTKKWETGRYYSPQEWKAKNPNMDIGSMAFTPKKDEFSSLLRIGEDTPNPFKEGAKKNKKPMTKEIVDKYLKNNKNDPVKATKAAKDDGYDTTVVE
jgi:hypothetical protein